MIRFAMIFLQSTIFFAFLSVSSRPDPRSFLLRALRFLLQLNHRRLNLHSLLSCQTTQVLPPTWLSTYLLPIFLTSRPRL